MEGRDEDSEREKKRERKGRKETKETKGTGHEDHLRSSTNLGRGLLYRGCMVMREKGRH